MASNNCIPSLIDTFMCVLKEKYLKEFLTRVVLIVLVFFLIFVFFSLSFYLSLHRDSLLYLCACTDIHSNGLFLLHVPNCDL